MHPLRVSLATMALARLTVNFSGRVRKATYQGREYLVAPMTLINPGVLNGSKGPLLYPPDEIARNAKQWDGVPITIYHPHKLGQPVSAHEPGIWDRQGVGVVRNTTANGKLRAEGWFDAERTKKISPTVYNRLLANEPIELSTGLFTDNEERSGVFRGRQYTAVARNYRADHLAVLPDQLGACSVADGCGVLVNSDGLRRKLDTLVGNIIKQLPNGKWRLHESDGTGNLGTFDSREAAEKHEREVQYFKHANNTRAGHMTLQDKLNVLVGNSWEEGKHPRGQGGKFVSGSSGKGGTRSTGRKFGYGFQSHPSITAHGGLIASVTGGAHHRSKSVGQSHFHDISHADPGKAAMDAHDFLTSESASGASRVSNPKPAGHGWRVSYRDGNGDSHHVTFHRSGATHNADQILDGTDAEERKALAAHGDLDEEDVCEGEENCSQPLRNRLRALLNNWDESEHPREGGKFSPKGGESKSSGSEHFGLHDGPGHRARIRQDLIAKGFKHSPGEIQYKKSGELGHYAEQTDTFTHEDQPPISMISRRYQDTGKTISEIKRGSGLSGVQNRLSSILSNASKEQKDSEEDTVELKTDRPQGEEPKDANEAAGAHDLFPDDSESPLDDDDLDASDEYGDDWQGHLNDAEEENKDTEMKLNTLLQNKLNLLLGNWDESKHPRKGGKFVSKGGGGGSAGTPSPHQLAKSYGFKTVSAETTAGAQKSWMEHPTMTRKEAIKRFALKPDGMGGYETQTHTHRITLLGPEDSGTNKTTILVSRFRKGPAGKSHRYGVDNSFLLSNDSKEQKDSEQTAPLTLPHGW